MQNLEHIDQQIDALLADDTEIDGSQLQQLLSHRELVLEQLRSEPARIDRAQWQQAIERTSMLLERIHYHRDRSASQVQRLVHGQRSLQMYNKFR
ncbi:flagellar rod protein FlaI [Photobacterium nomapromontoriensis]|uniref:flagellar rod protein FlaI n=1 Tax=Photobacterium nomapromontoriensis TaxID=2910237 RepID=UPI003D09ED80